MSQTLAENLKRSLMNHPEVKLTIEQGGQHQPRYWSERSVLLSAFLFPTETGLKSKDILDNDGPFDAFAFQG
jgi:hypothetical protein